MLFPIKATVMVLLAPLVPPLMSSGTIVLRADVAALLRVEGRGVVGSVSVGEGREQFSAAVAAKAAGLHPLRANPNAIMASCVILRWRPVWALMVCRVEFRFENGLRVPPIISGSFPAAPVVALRVPIHARSGFKLRVRPADLPDMSISPASASAAYQARVDNDREIAVMKKARDVQKDQGEALVELVKQAAPAPPHVGSRINVLA